MPRVYPTSLKEAEIAQFQKIYFEETGIRLSNEQAREEGLSLLRFLCTVMYNGDFLKEE
jgi:hypothetical protein